MPYPRFFPPFVCAVLLLAGPVHAVDGVVKVDVDVDAPKTSPGEMPYKPWNLEAAIGYNYRTDGRQATQGGQASVKGGYTVILGEDKESDHIEEALGFSLSGTVEASITVGPDATGTEASVQKLRVYVRPLSFFEYLYMLQTPDSPFTQQNVVSRKADEMFKEKAGYAHGWEQAVAANEKEVEELDQRVRSNPGNDEFKKQLSDAKAKLTTSLSNLSLAYKDRATAKQLAGQEHAKLVKLRQTYQAIFKLRLAEFGYLHNSDALLGYVENVATAGITFELHRAYKLGDQGEFNLCVDLRLAGVAIGQQKTTRRDNTEWDSGIIAMWSPALGFCMELGYIPVGKVRVDANFNGRVWGDGDTNLETDSNLNTSVGLELQQIGSPDNPLSFYSRYEHTDLNRIQEGIEKRNAESFEAGVKVKF